MLPGKKYTPEDIVKILRKRFWIIVVPWAIVSAGVAGMARKLPDMYRSQAKIQVIPPQVPGSIVATVAPVSFDQRLQATSQSILSRTRLEMIIRDLKLYTEERKVKMMEDVVDGMRRDITVNPVKGDTFTVTYIGREPVTVMKVTEKLAGLFKDESVNAGVARAEGTNAFIESEVEDSHRKLLEIEDRLKQYRLSHAGEMPEQQAANMQAIMGINSMLSTIGQALSSDKNQKATLEHLIEGAQNTTDPVAVTTPITSGASDGPPRGSTAEQLLQAQNQLTYARTVKRLGPDNPEVKQLNSIIAALQKQVDTESSRSTVSGAATGTPVAMTTAERQRQDRLQLMQKELEDVKARIAANEAEQTRLRGLGATYQAKIDNAPLRDADLTEITREYETQKKLYNDNVAKREAASMSVKLEQRQIGEQFSLIDPARVPERPFSPDRTLLNLIGIVGGLGLGLAIVGLLEYRDASFKADHEVASVLSLPVLAVVPLMRSDVERRTAFRSRLILNLGLGSAVAVCLAVLAYTFVR